MLLAIPPASLSATSKRVYSAMAPSLQRKPQPNDQQPSAQAASLTSNSKALLQDGAAVDEDEFAAFEEWLTSLEG
jgi:hypothetical protein